MINTVLDLLNDSHIHYTVNMACHTVIFMGAFYVAVYNKRLPIWHVTPIWWVGLTSLFNILTIVFEYFLGPQFPLSYFNMALLAETAINASLAYLVLVMFVSTVIRRRH